MARTDYLDRLEMSRHHAILPLLLLAVFIIGILFGAHIWQASPDGQGLLIMVFAVSLLNLFMSFLLFTHALHTRRRIAELHQQRRRSP